MINNQILILSEKLDQTKGKVKTKLVEYGQNLQTYSTDEETTKFIKVIGENSANSDYYFERILISINNKHPKEWTDIDSDLVKQKLSENIKLIINLGKVRSYHLKDELTDPQEIAIMESVNILSNDAKIRLATKILKGVSVLSF
jgi:hypothetical protein